MDYHVLNRGNDRLRLFDKDEDYDAFESDLAEAGPLPGRALDLLPHAQSLVSGRPAWYAFDIRADGRSGGCRSGQASPCYRLIGGRPMTRILAASGGFLLAVLWMDLMFDVQVLPSELGGAPMPESAMALIAA